METQNTTNRETKIAIFSLPKTGTTTVMRAIQSAGMDAHRVHANNLHLFNMEQFDKIVTMVRDPIARKISDDFERKEIDPYNNVSWDWMNTMLTVRCGISVLKNKFNRVRGWSIYNKRVLVIRTESLSSQLAKALSSLLGIPADKFNVEHRAIGAERFGITYQQFIDALRLPEKDVDIIYNKANLSHFYTKTQIEEMKKRWTK